MDKSINYKWIVIVFFGMVGLMFAASLVYLAIGRVAPDTYWGRSMKVPTSGETSSGRSASKIVLRLNQGIEIGGRIFFYRGRRGDQILLDVIIPELDDQYAYPLAFYRDKAEKGFTVADRRLKLTTLRDSFITVRLLD